MPIAQVFLIQTYKHDGPYSISKSLKSIFISMPRGMLTE